MLDDYFALTHPTIIKKNIRIFIIFIFLMIKKIIKDIIVNQVTKLWSFMKNGKKDIILGIINNKLKHLILEKTPFT